jgi:hypothetical protein
MVALLSAGVNRQEQRTIDAGGVHCCHHLITCRRWRPMQVTNPGAARMISLVGMHLGIDNLHVGPPSSRPRIAPRRHRRSLCVLMVAGWGN